MKNIFPPKRILVPTDFSKSSDVAVETAKALAKAWNSLIRLLYVQAPFEAPVQIGPVGVPTFVQLSQKQIDDILRRRERNFRREMAGFPKSRMSVKSVVGWPSESLARLARVHPADLIVMGTHGYAGWGRFFWGSVTEMVVRRSDVPVLILHRSPASARFSKILVPCNLTSYADRALAYAARFGQSVGARLSVLYVIRPGTDWPSNARRLLETHLNKTLGLEGTAETELIIREGDPRSVILQEARKGKYGLVALSAHRRRFMADFVLGSTVERVLRHCPIPVLAVPSAETKHPLRVRDAAAALQWLAGKIY